MSPVRVTSEAEESRSLAVVEFVFVVFSGKRLREEVLFLLRCCNSTTTRCYCPIAIGCRGRHGHHGLGGHGGFDDDHIAIAQS